MSEKIRNVNKMNGGGALLRLKKYLQVFIIMLLIMTNVKAEVPHSYITENPSKEITVTDTVKKYKEKAELNISVTKLKSEEVLGICDSVQKKLYFSLENTKYGIKIEDHIYVSEKLEEVPSISTTNGRKKINRNLGKKVLKEGSLEYKVNKTNDITTIEINYTTAPKEIYIGVLNNEYEIKKILKGINKKNKITTLASSESLGTLYNRDYDALGWGVTRSLKETIFESINKYGKNTFFKKVSGTNKIKVGHKQNRPGNFGIVVYGYNRAGNLVYTSPEQGHLSSYSANPYQWAQVNWSITLPEYCTIIMKVVGDTGDPYQDNSNGNNTIDIGQVTNVKLEDKISTLIGKSTLTIKEYYPTNEFIQFNSTTTDDGKALTLENSLKDVALTTEEQGLVHLQSGDRFAIDGKILTIGAGGNLSEQIATSGNLKYTYKVESGKLRIALNDWGILEPNRTMSIEAWRTEDGEEKKLTEHQLTIISPRKISGESEVKFSEDYKIRDTIRFQGVSLEAPGIMNLETPIPPGVSLKAVEGYGIPFLKEGDILEIGSNITRSAKQYTIGTGDSLKKTIVELPGTTTLSLDVENGKVRLGLNSWLVNKNANLSLRAIRGTNEISRNIITLEAPEAPFDVVKNGILDFGTILAGSNNKYAETDIVLEMLQDVTEIKYSLSTSEPELENPNGKKLKAKDIKAVVLKQGNRRYLLKVQGYLDVPKEQELGEYRGSMILNVNIK